MGIFSRSSDGFFFNSRDRAVRAITTILNDTHPFYRHLSKKGADKFVVRVARFISAKRFIGMEGLEVTFEMKVRIAATAVQLTFGLDRTGFSHYKVIKIFPSSFYSRIHDRYLKGGASTGGSLMFSWHDFQEGYADPADRYNLGLHEMAHALRIELKYGTDFDSRFADYSDHWVKMALPEFEKMNKGNTSFLRDYGGTNVEEFFAVCIEHFFEVPHEFKQHLPDIFNHLCFLLNLDPTRINDDYQPEPDFVQKVNSDPKRMPLPLKVGKAYQYYNWHWSFNFIVAGLFLGSAVVVYLYGKVLYSGWHILLTFGMVTAVLTSLAGFFYRYGIFFFRHLLFFSLAGVSPLITAVLLVFNYNVTRGLDVSVHRVVDYRIINMAKDGHVKRYYLVELEDDAFRSYRDIRSFSSEQLTMKDLQGSVYVLVTTSKGVLGLNNLESSSILIYR
jgi:MtfA peptidase